MRIKKILYQHRRDFRAIYVCPFCGYEKEGSGYDDAYFHQNVIPEMICDKCGKTEKDGTTYQPRATKYPEGFQI